MANQSCLLKPKSPGTLVLQIEVVRQINSCLFYSITDTLRNTNAVILLSRAYSYAEVMLYIYLYLVQASNYHLWCMGCKGVDNNTTITRRRMDANINLSLSDGRIRFKKCTTTLRGELQLTSRGLRQLTPISGVLYILILSSLYLPKSKWKHAKN